MAQEAASDAQFSPRMVDSLIDAVLILEDQGRLIYANPAVERLLGWNVALLFGAPLTDLLPERLRAESVTMFKEWMATDPPLRSPAPIRMTMLRADGSEIPVDVGVFLVAPEQGSRLVIAALWDASGRIDIDRYQRVADDLLTFLAGASGSTEEIVPQLLAILATSLDFDFATAWGWDPDSELLHCDHVWRSSESEFSAILAASSGMTVRPGEGLAGLVVSSDEPIWFNELTDAPHLRRHEGIVIDGLNSGFVFPIRTKERLLGVIELLTRARRQPDTPLFDAVAEVCARLGEFIERLELEWERTNLLAELGRSKAQQDFLLRANRVLVEANGFEDTVLKLAEVAVPTLGDICLIDVLDANGSLVRLAARHADPARQSLTDQLAAHAPEVAGTHPAALAVRMRESQWSVDMDERFMRTTTKGDDHYELTQLLGFESYVSVPLLTENEAIGALTLVTAGSGRPLGKDELLLAEALAGQVAAVIEQARVFDEQSTIARRLQNSLLPAGIDQVPGISVAARYVTSDRGAEVGGDFYDVVPLSDDEVALAIGDVEGHDMTAATVMGQLRSAMRAYLMLTHDPAAVLSLLDTYAAGQSARLATVVLAVLNTTSGRMQMASAGHPPPILFDGRAPAAPLILRPGTPIGMGRGGYDVESLDLVSGVSLVFYTDGLIDEARPGAEDLMRGLAQSLEKCASGGCQVLADDILMSLTSLLTTADDIALLAVRWPALEAGTSYDPA
jgi:PAS domain S-box-containing protein